jgi:hypothetical protein
VFDLNDPDGTSCAGRHVDAPSFYCGLSDVVIDSMLDMTSGNAMPILKDIMGTLDCSNAILGEPVLGPNSPGNLQAAPGGSTGAELYAYDHHGPMAVVANEATIGFIKANDGFFFYVVLDKPKSGECGQQLSVTASKLVGKLFRSTSIVANDPAEVTMSNDKRTVTGDFKWNRCCSNGFGIGGIEDDFSAGTSDPYFEVDITFAFRQKARLIERIYFQSATGPRSLISPENLAFQKAGDQ